MTGKERREQLLDIGRRLFAERGFEGTSIEEIAAQAGVSKPVDFETAAVALLRYIEDNSDGFRILARDSHPASGSGSFGSLLSDLASQVEYMLGDFFRSRGYDPKLAPMYSQMLVGMVAVTGQWWLDARKPKVEVVAAHLINLAWNGLSQLDHTPSISAAATKRPASPRR